MENVKIPLPRFNLGKIMARVAKENPDWPSEKLTLAEADYRLFLAQVKKSKEHKKRAPRPSPETDKVWHAHIVFTRKYASDCSAYFGYFLHHTPATNNDWGCDVG